MNIILKEDQQNSCPAASETGTPPGPIGRQPLVYTVKETGDPNGNWQF